MFALNPSKFVCKMLPCFVDSCLIYQLAFAARELGVIDWWNCKVQNFFFFNLKRHIFWASPLINQDAWLLFHHSGEGEGNSHAVHVLMLLTFLTFTQAVLWYNVTNQILKLYPWGRSSFSSDDDFDNWNVLGSVVLWINVVFRESAPERGSLCNYQLRSSNEF